MIKAILNGLISFITGFINLLLTPINTLVQSLFPSLNDYLTVFNNMISNYVGPTVGWFFNLIPPITKSIVLMFLTFLIAYYTTLWTYLGIIKIWNIIRKVKFW